MIYLGTTKFPEGWSYSKYPDHYYYRGILVRRIDRGAGLVELVTVDETIENISVLEMGFVEAMEAMSQKLRPKVKD